MFPYLVMIGVPVFIGLAYHEHPNKVKISNRIISAFFIIFIVLLALRGMSCGNDTIGYKSFYEHSKFVKWSDIFVWEVDFEHGYAILQKIFSGCSVNFQWFLLIVSLASLFPIWWFYLKEAEIPLLTIALFVAIAPFSMYFSGLRQILAMAFAIPAFYFTRQKKPLSFLLMVFLAFMFHRSAFILLLIYPVCQINITKYRVWFIVPIIGFIWLYNEQIFRFLMEIVSDIYSGEIEQTGAYTVLILLIVFAVYSFLIPEEGKLDEETKALRNLLLLSVCLQCFAPINPLAMRFNYYYLIFVPVLIPKIAKNSKNSLDQITEVSILGMTTLFILYFYYNLLHGGGLNIYPYKFFWS